MRKFSVLLGAAAVCLVGVGMVYAALPSRHCVMVGNLGCIEIPDSALKQMRAEAQIFGNAKATQKLNRSLKGPFNPKAVVYIAEDKRIFGPMRWAEAENELQSYKDAGAVLYLEGSRNYKKVLKMQEAKENADKAVMLAESK